MIADVSKAPCGPPPLFPLPLPCRVCQGTHAFWEVIPRSHEVRDSFCWSPEASSCSSIQIVQFSGLSGPPSLGVRGSIRHSVGAGGLASVGQPCSARALRVHSPCQLTLGFDEPSKGLQIFSPWNFAARSPASSLVFRAAGGLVTRVRQEVALASPRTSCRLFLFGAVHVIRHTRL